MTQTSTQATVTSGCLKCGAKLYPNGYGEPHCLMCGWIDYSYTPPQRKREFNVLARGTDYVFRYIGDFPDMHDVLLRCRIEKLNNRVVNVPTCPFCRRGDMAQSSLSGKRREISEERFKCEEGHRISLTRGNNGVMGWR